MLLKYPPKHHQDNDRNHIIEVIKTYPLATIISVKNNEPLITHLPLIFKDDKLVGHIDIYNPQTQLLKDNNNITILFYGPQCYISDRKSTRLNSSHGYISYAVFCLKKKKEKRKTRWVLSRLIPR